MRAVLIEKDVYFDSVLLMRISSQLKQLPGVVEGVVSHGTDMNKSVLTARGFATSELEMAGANDLLIAIEAQSQRACDTALEQARQSLQALDRHSRPAAEVLALPTQRAALRVQRQANLALISVPGAYAAREAAVALALGLHAMVFSDNVTLDDEVTLKRLAVSKGLFLMGPDCGTALINGHPLGFANRVRRGTIGIVGASGTGIQEVTCQIDAMGAGVSQAIGTGGRDLQDPRVGGMMTLQGIAALDADPHTEVIVIITKPPHPEVAQTVLRRVQQLKKPVVAHFLGRRRRRSSGRVQFASSLLQTAALAVACVRPDRRSPGRSSESSEIPPIARREAANMAPRQCFLRGLFTGGSLAEEACFRLDGLIGPVYSNLHTTSERALKDPSQSYRHTVVDLGDDVFTRGRPHPMIDPTLRALRIRQEGDDPRLGLLLLDLVLGYGAHDDPAGAIIPAIAEARAAMAARGGYLPVVVSITGTDADPQDRAVQRHKLQTAGCIVASSNYQAVQTALAIAQQAWGRKKQARAPQRDSRT